MEKMVTIEAQNGHVYGEMSKREYDEAMSMGEMAFQIYVDWRFGRIVGGKDHAGAMQEARRWDAMMRGEMTIEEFEAGE